MQQIVETVETEETLRISLNYQGKIDGKKIYRLVTPRFDLVLSRAAGVLQLKKALQIVDDFVKDGFRRERPVACKAESIIKKLLAEME